jgi:MFS family permease
MILVPVLGGVITQGLAWRWVFWLNIPIGVAVMLASRRLRESHGVPSKLDLRGLAP